MPGVCWDGKHVAASTEAGYAYRRVGGKPFAKPADMYVQAACTEIIIVAPKFFKKISQRDELSLIVA